MQQAERRLVAQQHSVIEGADEDALGEVTQDDLEPVLLFRRATRGDLDRGCMVAAASGERGGQRRNGGGQRREPGMATRRERAPGAGLRREAGFRRELAQRQHDPRAQDQGRDAERHERRTQQRHAEFDRRQRIEAAPGLSGRGVSGDQQRRAGRNAEGRGDAQRDPEPTGLGATLRAPCPALAGGLSHDRPRAARARARQARASRRAW